MPLALVALQQIFDYRQPYAMALLVVIGSDTALEQLGFLLLCNARAIVFDADVQPFFATPGFEYDFAVCCLAGVIK